MIKKAIFSVILVVSLLFVTSGCEDWLDVNDDLAIEGRPQAEDPVRAGMDRTDIEDDWLGYDCHCQ